MKKKAKALFVGLNTVDVQFFVRQFPKSNTKTKVENSEIASGGPATNASIAAAVLGCDSTLISPVGKHSLSQFLTDDITKYGVKLIDPVKGISTNAIFASIITNEGNGDRTIFSYMPEDSIDHFIEDLPIDLSDFDIALFDGFYPVMSSIILQELKRYGVTTVLDGGSWKPGMEKILPNIDIAILSNDFLPPFCETKYDTINLLQSYNIKSIAITNGQNPILVYDGRMFSEIRVRQVNAIDMLGAGDIFHGAFVASYLKNNLLPEALKEAAWVASHSCTYRGTRSWIEEYKMIGA